MEQPPGGHGRDGDAVKVHAVLNAVAVPVDHGRPWSTGQGRAVKIPHETCETKFAPGASIQ
jgi:hypothetical protein